MTDSEASTPTPHHQSVAASGHESQPGSTSSSSYFTYPVSYAVTGLLRRLSSEPHNSNSASKLSSSQRSLSGSETLPSSGNPTPLSGSTMLDSSVIYTPKRTASPFQPPPLASLVLSGWRADTAASARLLSHTLAEEIRLLVPPRLQLVDEWKLVFSLEQDGVSLATLYGKCEALRGKRGGFVLVVRDGGGGVFGAYLSDAPHPHPHYYGNGECFLWRASFLPSILDLSHLPPPPSADTTHLGRQTTLLHPRSPTAAGASNGEKARDGTRTPDRIRFKAFPYSGVNDYMIYAQPRYLSVGGGDGHYGLWLDDSLDKGVSSPCPTFGNEPLSDDGSKFDVLGVELWYVG